MSSEDGWEPSHATDDQLEWIVVPGTNPPVHLQLFKGQPLIIMRAYAADYNAYVESLRDGDSAGFTPTNSVATSNHLNGTAMDLNWNDHPFHVSYGGYSQPMIDTTREILAFYESTMFWGQDWGGNPFDCMHHQMGYDTYGADNVARVQDFINRKIRSDGYSTFRRGGTVPPPALSRADRYALACIREGQRLNITPRGIQIALSVELVETNLTMYANSNDPPSLDLPHDAVGSDHMSSGLFQQQTSWGPLADRMDPTRSATIFFLVDNGPGVRGLTKIRDGNGDPIDYNDPANSMGYLAQKVQGSAFPDRYNERMGEAIDLYNRLVGTTTPPPITPPPIGPPLEGFLMALTDAEQAEVLDKVRGLCAPMPSKARYGDPAILWTPTQYDQNDDGFLFDLITEHDAALGDTAALARVEKAAVAGDTIARAFLDRMAGVQQPAVAAAPQPRVYAPVAPLPVAAPVAAPVVTTNDTGSVIADLYRALDNLRLADALPIEARAPLQALVQILNTKNGTPL